MNLPESKSSLSLLFPLQTCPELERYLQTEPKRLSELFDQDLDGLLTPAYLKEDGEEELTDVLLPSLPSLPEPPSPPPVLLCPTRKSFPSTGAMKRDLKPKGLDSIEAMEGVHQAQLSAVTSLTPPSSPELGRHLVKPNQTLTASADGTLTLKLVARKVARSSRWEVGGAGWNPHAQFSSTIALCCNDKLELYTCTASGDLSQSQSVRGHTRQVTSLHWSCSEPSLLASAGLPAPGLN